MPTGIMGYGGLARSSAGRPRSSWPPSVSCERIYPRPWLNTQPNAELKTAARTAIDGLGYRIVATIGNSATDRCGGHADRTFTLPDYDGPLGRAR